MRTKKVSVNERITTSVTVSAMEFKWLTRGGKGFRDFVKIINEAQNTAIIKTNFMQFLLKYLWQIYYRKIFWSQFLPSLCYQLCMLHYLIFMLEDIKAESLFNKFLCKPFLGFTLVLMCNSIMTEYLQWKNSINGWDYLMNIWNFNDIFQLLIFILVLVIVQMEQVDEMLIRMIAAIGSCSIWFKLIDWLRLFNQTAFFIFLIRETIGRISNFLIIMVLWYLMFGTAFYLLNFNREPEHAIIKNLSPVWFFDAFVNSYELSLGEYQVENFLVPNGSKWEAFMCYFLFILATFLIQIVFLNMLISIMSDSFSYAMMEKNLNANSEKLRILGDYIHVFDSGAEGRLEQSADDERFDEKNRNGDNLQEWILNQGKTTQRHEKELFFMVRVTDEAAGADMYDSWDG